MWKVQWNENTEKMVPSSAALESLLDNIHAKKKPILVEVETQHNGNSLTIGLGSSKSVLSYVSGSGDPPYYLSVGSNHLHEYIEYYYRGESSEIPLKNSIPIKKARMAMREFLKSARMPCNITWEKV